MWSGFVRRASITISQARSIWSERWLRGIGKKLKRGWRISNFRYPIRSNSFGFYAGYWEACIADASAPFCVCALLAGQLPVLPEEVGLEVRAHFRSLSAWLTSVLERGARHGQLQLMSTPRAEAEAFMAAVHGAMLSARAYGDPKIFGVVTGPLLERLAPQILSRYGPRSQITHSCHRSSTFVESVYLLVERTIQ